MLCRPECPRNTDCRPIGNVVSDDDSSFVCVGFHNTKKEKYTQDVFRHCFKSGADTDTMFDYDEYDLKSCISVMSDALIINQIENGSRE